MQEFAYKKFMEYVYYENTCGTEVKISCIKIINLISNSTFSTNFLKYTHMQATVFSEISIKTTSKIKRKVILSDC